MLENLQREKPQRSFIHIQSSLESIFFIHWTQIGDLPPIMVLLTLTILFVYFDPPPPTGSFPNFNWEAGIQEDMWSSTNSVADILYFLCVYVFQYFRESVIKMALGIGSSIFKSHESFISKSLKSIFQNQAFQIMFDLKFILKLFGGNLDSKEKVRNIIILC